MLFENHQSHRQSSNELLAEEEGTSISRIIMTRRSSREHTPLLRQSETNDSVSSLQTFLNQNDSSDDDDKDPLMEVIDRIEDEVDHTWEELVPLEVKLALEERVFGWSHLTSDILGHVFFTVAAYSLVFFLLTRVGHLQERINLVLFRVIRFTLSFWAGLSAYRMVRRRRKVWLRSAYGTRDYERDSRRRRYSVREIDRTTLLGRIRRSRALRAAKKQQKKLRKAVERFEKRDEKRKRTLDPTVLDLNDDDEPTSPRSVSLILRPESDPTLMTTEQLRDVRKRTRQSNTFHALPVKETKAIGHDQILFAHGPIEIMPYAHGGFFGAAPFMLANPHWIDVLRLLMPDVYIEISLRVVHAPAPKLIHWAENNPVVAAYGTAHELDNTNTIPNLEWDVFLDPHLVRRVEVVLKEQEKFLRDCCASDDALQELSGKELRHVMLESVGSLGLTTSQRSILAYYEAELRRRVEHLVDNMLIAHGSLTQLVLEQTGYLKKYNFSRVKRARRTLGGGMFARQWLAVYAEALKLGKCLDGSKETSKSKKRQALLYSSSSVLRTNSSSDEDESTEDCSFQCQCLQCSTDLLHRQQSDVTCTHQRNAKSKELRGSQSFSDLTSETFVQEEPNVKSAPVSPVNRNNQVSPFSSDAVTGSKALSTSIAESITVIKFITGCDDPLGIVFDIKSRHTSKPVWGLIVDYLRDAGARVEGIASFIVDEVRDISQYTSKPVRELFFFHSAGDVQQACHDGRLKPGDAVLFNAGSLLFDSNSTNGNALNCLTWNRYWTTSFDADEVKRRYFILPFGQFQQGSQTSTLKNYKEKFGLSIGLYCQEFAIDEAAISLLVKYANENSDVYDLGLSWGGVNGITVRGIQPGRFTLTDGFWNQRYGGESWDYLRYADECVTGS